MEKEQQSIPPLDPPEKQHKPQSATPKQSKKYPKPSLKLALIISVVILAVLTLAAALHRYSKPKDPMDLLTTASLEKIIEVSELSTYDAVYNGIVEVRNTENADQVDYYVSYESKVKVGIELADVQEYPDHENKKICVVLPEVIITDVTVDFGSMDFIFVKEEAETETVAQQAYKACIADANSECENEMDIYLLAKKNAENIVTALVQPLLSVMDEPYELEIRWEG